ncbi:hypothetical protein ACIQWA_35460 [Kitasatospora sp. NPDC098652]
MTEVAAHLEALVEPHDLHPEDRQPVGPELLHSITEANAAAAAEETDGW